ncbi:uncharacterized protein LOC109985487 [Xyrichtys novacula]|uniref:Uncharacterized protein LOC109985487 n=1 Tax=Xyrichtys novacula TaxID=13765 RepID=A0AAV1HES8_XYRNO|nr:uncharacterized protein LOC109985487 [Xyrichtys novacula]
MNSPEGCPGKPSLTHRPLQRSSSHLKSGPSPFTSQSTKHSPERRTHGHTLIHPNVNCLHHDFWLQDFCCGSSLAPRGCNVRSVQARNGDKSESNFTTSLAWMEAKDMCNPEALQQQSSTCIGKMLEVLRNYDAYVEKISKFESCSQFANKVKPALINFHRDVSICVRSRAGMEHHEESDASLDDSQSLHPWQEPLLCHYTLDRLFSFSILSARVFAVGDPAHHSEGSAQKCM